MFYPPERIAFRADLETRFYLYELSTYYSTGLCKIKISDLVKSCIKDAYAAAFSFRSADVTNSLYQTFVSEVD